jgi:endogenous inhibitor of DNA gyrase (YacG/DUF329 family)
MKQAPSIMIRLPECPICQKSVPPATDPNANFAPFCSRRCKEVDLARWIDGRYAIVEPLDPARMAETLAQGLDPESEENAQMFEEE